MDIPSNEQDPSLNAVKVEPDEWDIPVEPWVSDIFSIDLSYGLETLSKLRKSTDIPEDEHHSRLDACRVGIIDYARRAASVEEKGTIVRKFLEGLDTAYGFHDPEDLVNARVVMAFGVDWPVVDEFNEFIERHKTNDPGWPLAITRLKIATEPEVIRDVVYNALLPNFDWGPAK